MKVNRRKLIFDNKFDIARRYFAIISAFNNLRLQPRELDLLAFMSVKGTIDSKNARDEFINTYTNNSLATLNNTISKLYKKKILIRDGNKKKMNPNLIVDFNSLISITEEQEKDYRGGGQIPPNEFKMEIRCVFKEKELMKELSKEPVKE